MSPAKRFFLARVFPWIVVVAGASAMFLGVENSMKAQDSLEWPTVEREVIFSSIESERSRSHTGSGSSRSITYRVRVIYEYAVDGTQYTGERIAYGEYATARRSDAERITDKYPTGKKVLVSYMPAHPEESVLEPGQAGLPWFFVGLGLIFLLTGIVLVIFLPKLVATVSL
jgi:hypothetical protein